MPGWRVVMVPAPPATKVVPETRSVTVEADVALKLTKTEGEAFCRQALYPEPQSCACAAAASSSGKAKSERRFVMTTGSFSS